MERINHPCRIHNYCNLSLPPGRYMFPAKRITYSCTFTEKHYSHMCTKTTCRVLVRMKESCMGTKTGKVKTLDTQWLN